MNLRVSLYTLFWIGLFISPIFFLQLSIEPSQVPRFAFVCLSLIAFFIWLLNTGNSIYLPKKVVLYPLLLFYLINLSSSFWSLNFAEGFYESQKILLFIALIIFSGTLVKGTKPEVLNKMLILGMVSLLAVSLLDLFLSLDHLNTDSLQLFGHVNILSCILLLSLILTAFAYYHFKKYHFAYAVVFAITLGLIIYLQTRSVFIGLILISIIVLAFSLTKLKSKKPIAIFAGVFAIGMVGLILLFSADHTSLSERLSLWSKSSQLIQENPLLGVGTGNWQFNYTQFGVADIPRAFDYNVAFKRPHNDFISIISEVGILGFLPVMWILIWMMKSIVQARKNIDWSYLIIICGLVGLFVFANFSFPKERITLIVLGSILFTGFLFKNDGLIASTQKKKDLISISFIAALILLLTMSFYRIKGEYHTKQILSNQELGKGLFVIDQSKKAQSIFYSVDPTGTPIKSYEGWGYNEITDLPSLLKANEEAVSLCPYNYQVLTNYGYILERSFQFKDAEKVLMFSHKINHKYEPTLLNLSVLNYNLGHYEESLNWLKKIDGYQTKYPQNLQRISQAILQTQ